VNATRTRRRRLLDRLVGRVPSPPPTPPTRVLVVDDDAVIRALVAVTLSDQGFEMFGAADAKEVFAMVTSVRPHVVILDATLPESAQGDVGHWLADDPRAAQLKVLLLEKPFEPDQLVAAIRALLA